ncbi:PTS sugar transporter [Virgibacillus dakarensis]|uniref:PTS sugar transporter n=1 Tax=Lentibacillus populi TaxID=1827502 RepID=A0A9W5X6F9_9BACI|nr:MULTISPECIES: PTS mannose/fructose/sorbose/N-acetylgalactosamine transporter subunit IIC [Bacillaceae]MBT2216402.1 PTS mannose/fructose/sorbose/N-acetylgalactosamine transporter subunit IIC [Virgibacillus dakarensis]MTW86592.1 PTS sugar transporter [Virgibacillus dakarensis]GGB47216.1 PTS sugar transporter [Lentibacillus populi]
MITALLLGLVAFVAQSEYALGTSLISRPIVTGLFTGIVMGDIKTGIIMGATLELAFIGVFSVGAAIPPNVVVGGVLGVAFAISSGAGPETALLLGLPIATLALIFENLYLALVLPIVLHKADRYAEDANVRGITTMHLLGGFGMSLMIGAIVGISYFVGSDAVTKVLDAIPGPVQTGLEVATGLIPALGFAMLVRLLVNKQVAPYFFLGFLIVAYLKVPVTGIALLGAIVAIIMVNVMQKPKLATNEGGVMDDDDEDF